jgi:hypothetical protein
LFIALAVLGMGILPQVKWLADRHRALGWVDEQAESWRDMPLDQRVHDGADAPWRLRLVGERGVQSMCVVVAPEAVMSRQIELERLFPEADVLVVSPGPGYRPRR